MPPRKIKTDAKPSKRLIILIAATVAVVAAAIAGIVIHIKNSNDYSTPEKAIAAAGLETDNIKKVFNYSSLAAAVDVKPGEDPVIYCCQLNDNKWQYLKSETIKPNSEKQTAFIFGTSDGSYALCVVFASGDKTAGMKLTASDAAVKEALASGTTGYLKFFAFGFDAPLKDTRSYTAIEFGSDNQQLASSDFIFSDGSFDITCNGTDYHYPVSKSKAVAAAFMERLDDSGLDFSLFSTEPNKADTFILTYTSAIHTVIRPANLSSAGISYDKVTIKMPLDGSDNKLIFISGCDHAVIAQVSAEKLSNAVMKLISGK